MAFEEKLLNPMGGQLGRSNLWKYGPTSDDLATVLTVGYFNEAIENRMRDSDTITTVCSDGTSSSTIKITASVVTLIPYTGGGGTGNISGTLTNFVIPVATGPNTIADSDLINYSTHIESTIPLEVTDGDGQFFKLPVLTTLQRDAIAVPANGMEIYNSDDQEFQVYQNGSWQTLATIERLSSAPIEYDLQPDYVLSSANRLKYLLMFDAIAAPPNAELLVPSGLPLGFECYVCNRRSPLGPDPNLIIQEQLGSGQVIVDKNGSAGPHTLPPYGNATLYQERTDEWHIQGDLA
jgi:hypothetical protein